MKFQDKVDERVHLDTADTHWQGGMRFYFRDLFTPLLVGTKHAEWADILWDGTAHGCGSEPHIRVVAFTQYKDRKPMGGTAKKFYEMEDLPKAFAWLAENTV